MNIEKNIDIYGDQDPRRIPNYTAAEASKYLRLSVSTLRSWAKGRGYTYQDVYTFSGPIMGKSREGIESLLSFENIIEAHIIKSLRTIHGVSMKKLKVALDTAENKFGINNLLLSPNMRAAAGQLFLEQYGQLINLSLSGQYAMKKIFEAHLRRVEYDIDGLPMRFYPFLKPDSDDSKKSIVINPFVSFGKPTVANRNISTYVIVNRIDAGEDINDVADDYDLDIQDVEDAIIYERAA
ncbi:MAG: DUF433 domain-containing protein [Deltaproteobacteria bacterium]|nr:DUF433 domain-containing protein [Deltaproteobacteria bacterium]